VRAAAQKNLAALYVNVGDFDQAIDTLGSNPVDGEAWHLMALALKGAGDLGESLKAFDKALAANPNASMVVFNHGLALGSSNLYREAARKMSRYIELENPPVQHVSRLLFKLWKEKTNDKLPE
jgi:Tfp pilus assembly protein PilF